MSFKPISVSKLSTYIKQIFDAEELLHGIAVYGEISGWSNVRGTAYFTLKDEGSALSCVCFSANDFPDVKSGDSVLLIGSVRYYPKGGKLNFNVVKIEPYGQSVLYQKFLELKDKLEVLGYFNQDRKKPMPNVIRRIGVVSSRDGAVIQDIINIRTRRNPNIDIVLYPVKVQGVGAEFEIAHGIEILDNYDVDVIVVARGGGSFEDLQPFNTEVVADAIYKCNKFIMSAVGHETDYTIIDFCSDMRAPTPSAAAELLCVDTSLQKDRTNRALMSLVQSMDRYVLNREELLQKYCLRMIDDFGEIVEFGLDSVNQNLVKLKYMADRFFEQTEQRLVSNAKILDKLNPNEVLKLGYACVRSSSGYISSLNDIEKGQNIDVVFKDGFASCNVIDIKENI